MLTIHNDADIEINYKENIKANDRLNKALSKPARVNKQLLDGLSNFQKTLLITDGTVTELLEYYLDESIKVEKLYEEMERDIECLPRLHKSHIDQGDFPVLIRKVLLQGNSTLRNWLYAETSVLIDRLPLEFRDDLMISDNPIGKLWSKYRFETYKTDFTIEKEKASDELANYLNISVNSDVLSRTYCVYSRGEKTMIITEKFSNNFFID